MLLLALPIAFCLEIKIAQNAALGSRLYVFLNTPVELYLANDAMQRALFLPITVRSAALESKLVSLIAFYVDEPCKLTLVIIVLFVIKVHKRGLV